MPRLSRLRWPAALLFAVLQLARIGAAWVDDVRMAQEDGAPVALHIEQQGGSGHCPPVHPANCAICSTLATPALASAVTAPALAATVRAVQAPTAVAPLLGGTARHLPDSRAPPLA